MSSLTGTAASFFFVAEVEVVDATYKSSLHMQVQISSQQQLRIYNMATQNRSKQNIFVKIFSEWLKIIVCGVPLMVMNLHFKLSVGE